MMLDQMPTRVVELPGYVVTYREWTRRMLRDLTPEEVEDFFLYEVISSIVADDGKPLDVDDIPAGALVQIGEAIQRGLSPNGRAGSRRRR